MAQLLYALQFTGTATPVSDSPLVMKAATSAPSATITTTVSASGVQGAVEPVAGESAQFESRVTMTGDATFEEHGSISFGAGNRLHFSTRGEGYLGPSAREGLSTGAVLWKVESGEGQLAGVSGYITSNFSVSATGAVVDHQLGVLFIPSDGQP
ncbi:MAG: hypothetical protein ACYDCQ_08545 [Dehalococcoidia bacterium]